MSATRTRFAPLNLLATIAAVFIAAASSPGQSAKAEPPTVRSFKSPVQVASEHPEWTANDIVATNEMFSVWLPANYNKSTPYGLVVFISPENDWKELPRGWDKVLEERKLLYVSPQGAGNDQSSSRRLALGVVAAREMMLECNVDPNRVYAAGYSGGARMAGLLGFFEPSLFHGTIQSCGADFYAKVPPVAKRGPKDQTDDYGFFDAAPGSVDAAKKKVKFAIITGSNDFRHAQIVDIFHGGFEKEGYQAKLIDVAGMQHEICSSRYFSAALDFIEGTAATPAASPVAGNGEGKPGANSSGDPAGPAWASSDPSKWPQILGYNDGVLTNNNGIGGSAFLMKLPNNAVVAATAVHVFGDGVKAEDLEKLVKSWVISPKEMPGKKVPVRKMVMKIDPADPLDCALFSVGTSPYPITVLTPRLTPASVGDVVYVLGVTHGAKGSQNAYKATVVSRRDDSEFVYTFDPEIDTNGFSGAPVLDPQGRVVGIHLGHTEMDGKKAWFGMDIATPIARCTAPAVVSDTIRPASSAGQLTHSDNSSQDEVKAASSLGMAQNYIDAGKYDIARSKLQNIIESYPGTAAAKKAKDVLNSIAGK